MNNIEHIKLSQENELSRIVVNAGLHIHKELGAGLLESAYEKCLFYELSKQGLSIEKQKNTPFGI